MTVQPKTPKQDIPIVASYARFLRARNRATATIAGYLSAVRLFLDFVDGEWDKASRHDVEAWMVHELERGSVNSANARWRALKQFYKWLEDEDEITRNPMERTRPPAPEESPKDIARPEDVSNVLNGLRKRRKWRDAAIVAILYDTGLRAGELVRLRVEDLDMDTGLLMVRHETSAGGARTKGKRGRIVRLSAPTLEIVDRYTRRRKKDQPWLIAGTRGQLSRGRVWAIVNTRFKEAGVESIGAHDLRHTAATALIGEMGESEMMSFFGWRNSNMVRRYADQRINEAALNAHRKASPMERLGR